MERLEKNIKLLQKKITEEISCINCGGCIHFAYYLSKRLAELRIKHSITFLGYNPIYLTYDKFYSMSHVMVYIESIGYIDGEEIVKGKVESEYYYYRNVKKISFRKLDAFRNNYSWNNEYDTSQNQLLETLINETITN